MDDLQTVADRYMQWAVATFDPMDPRPLPERIVSCLRHAEKEIGEARDNPGDPTEFTDVIGLTLFAARLAGHSLTDLTAAWAEKLGEMERRQWARTPEGTIEHVRT